MILYSISIFIENGSVFHELCLDLCFGGRGKLVTIFLRRKSGKTCICMILHVTRL